MKKALAITTGLSLLLLMFGGVTTMALAHSGSDSSGSGSSGDEEIDELDQAAELRIRDNGEVRIKDGEVIKVGFDAFDVSVQGMTFMVHVMADTQFEEDVMLSDLMKGDIVEVRGTIDEFHPHMIHADEVKIED